MGCPQNAALKTQSAEEAFQSGSMLWRQDILRIYAIYNDSTWQGFADTFRDGVDPQYSCGPTSSPPSPVRGFSKVWCNNNVRTKLGNATEAERGYCMSGGGPCAVFQDFNGGMMFYSQRFGAVYALLNDGTWRR